MARTLLRAVVASDPALKPQPPADLHERMAQALRAMGDSTEAIPEDAFTHLWMVENFHLSPAQASRRIKHMLHTGQIKKAGRKGYVAYYVFADGDSKPRA